MNTVARDLDSLSSLLVSSEDNGGQAQPTTQTPGTIGPAQLYDHVKVAPSKPLRDPKEIWHPDEVEDNVEDDLDDGRACPSYEFTYQQAVGTHDAFLGLSDKDPSSTQCEEIVLRVELPGVDSIREIDLELKPTHVKLFSPKYKLTTYLPHKIDEDRSKAEW
eukprot:CAMPEP_0177589550 /NCGR_PEP_ID=MMETSP0419_2-20121207/6874_1 /TAXON_ID=582737 /ORGANISM="Tetraselmis sp., Strain GSL018" /LENGTH=161 /DNA_ID=CAMNT_0019079933 /DNA_START=72 /DNA_END=554 /DNA_ORIENTATION=+